MTEVLIFATILSVDTFVASFFYGLKGIKIPFLSRIVFSAVSVFYGIVAFFSADLLKLVFPDNALEKFGGILLVLTGIVLLIKENKNIDKDRSGIIDVKEALALGFVLSLDMLGAGTGFVMGEKISFVFPFAAGVFQFVMLGTGIYLGGEGKKTAAFLKAGKKTAEIIPPVIIILLGIAKEL